MALLQLTTGQNPALNTSKLETQAVHVQAVHNRTLSNRIEAVISHISWYSFKTQARLAQDSGISKAAVSRLIRGKCQPSLALALKVTKAIEQRLGQRLDVWELFSLDGTYPTASACELVGCGSCLPQSFYDAEDRLKPQFKNISAGQWSLSQSYQVAAIKRAVSEGVR